MSLRWGRILIFISIGGGWAASFGATPAPGADWMRAPSDVHGELNRVSPNQRGALLLPLVRFFRTTISPVDGDRCPMYPTCSQYGEQALSRHGAIVGLMMIVDRLFHEWSETSLAPEVVVHGVRRYWDPVEANDFWFREGVHRLIPEHRLGDRP